MKKVGLVGWRGMVGSVLVQRMLEEGDFKRIAPSYFSTSAVGAEHTDVLGVTHRLLDATSISQLADMDIVISCQGGGYTKVIYDDLRNSGWDGYWIDAASTKRMDNDSVIILDPLNRVNIDVALNAGIKNYIGGNCSISLTLLGLAGLFQAGLVEWLNVMTYQAASGAGAAYVREMLSQMKYLSESIHAELSDSNISILNLLNKASAAIRHEAYPCTQFETALAGSLIPWIDSDLGNGVSREEWKGGVETNKILGLPPGTIGVDGLCVRIGALQCHSAAVVLKLKKEVPVEQLALLIKSAHEWVEFVPNTKQDTLHKLTPAAVSGSLKIAVGRLRKLEVGENLYGVMTVGDQLRWGAAEPLRRMLRILLNT